MKKRDFIKTSITGTTALFVFPTLTKASVSKNKLYFEATPGADKITNINGLISKQEALKHYKAYFQKPSLFLQNKILDQGAKRILTKHKRHSSDVVENSSDYLNHRIYFQSLYSDICRDNQLLDKYVIEQFGSYKNLKDTLITASKEHKSGWIWLSYSNGNLTVSKLDGVNNPLTQDSPSFPILGIDLHEHAFAPTFGNNKAEYTKEFLANVNWSFVDKRLSKAIKLNS